jgi:pantoate--beta-alanine ligase
MSLFVNPLQFNDPSDLDRYPRTFDADLAIAAECGVDALWAPLAEEMYPTGEPLTRVVLRGVTESLEGAHRPGHFDGVATVVAKLFNQVQADAAWFGRKDAQQLAVIRRMTADLDLPTRIEEHPTVREASGLAMSSRNALMSPEDRAGAALRLSAGIFAAADLAEAGERSAAALRAACASDLDYSALVDADTFAPLTALSGRAVLAVAGRVGAVRLIDNVLIETTPGGAVRVDRGIRLCGGLGGHGHPEGDRAPPMRSSYARPASARPASSSERNGVK